MSAPAPAAAAASSAPAVQPLPANHTLLYLANLPFSITQDALQAWLTKQSGAKVSGVTVVMRKGKEGPRSRGIGFAQVPTDKLEAVLALKDQDLEGRPFDVQVAKVQVAGGGEREPREKKEKAPRAPREPAADGAAAPTPSARRRNRRKGAGAGAAAAAGGEAGASSSSAAPKASKRQSTVPDANHTLLYVNNLSFEATQEDVTSLFNEKLGAAPAAVELVLSKFGRFKGRSRGFAFVTVKNEQVAKALQINGTQYQEREVGVAVAKDKEAPAQA